MKRNICLVFKNSYEFIENNLKKCELVNKTTYYLKKEGFEWHFLEKS